MKPLSKDIFDQIKFIKTCPLCKTTYSDEAIRMISDERSARWLHITCVACGSSFMAVVVTAHGGVSSVGMLTDLNYDDAIRFRNEHAVSTDDCLLLHRTLNDSDVFNETISYDLSTEREPAHRKGSARARKR